MQGLLIPVIKSRIFREQYSIPRSLVISSAQDGDFVAAHQLIDDLSKLGLKARLIKGAASASITIRRNKRISHPEGYELGISADGIEIVSSTDAGAYYGVQTLREIFTLHQANPPYCFIEDRPALGRRAVYQDCSRGKVPSVSTIKSFVEQLSRWKINEYQIYVENVFTFKKHPLIGKGFSPFTPQDILEIQDHCKKHHVRFVPSLTGFGHFEKILMIPKYTHLGELKGYRNMPGGTTLCPLDPGSIKLVSDMYGEYLPLFSSEDFNACGDEPWELGEGRSKTQSKRVSKGRLYLDFILKLHDLCLKHGKRMNLWGDIVLKHPEIIPQIPKDIVLLNWDYYPAGNNMRRTIEFAQAGLPFLCCPGINDWQSHGTRVGIALNNISQFTRIAVAQGAEGQLNTSWGDSGHRNTLGAGLLGYAAGGAHAWNGAGVDDNLFIRRFARHVFGDATGAIAASLECLGGKENNYWTYIALVESLAEPRSLASAESLRNYVLWPQATIDAQNFSWEQIQQRTDELKALAWPFPQKGISEFQSISQKEIVLAANMELLAWRRYHLAKMVRAKQAVTAVELQRHADEMEKMAKEFERLWLLRNKPSRLKDNMDCFAAAVKEARRLGR